MKFEIEIETSSPESLAEIEKFELANKLVLPSDYKYLLLNHNELMLANDAMAMILDEDGEEISGIDGRLSSLEQYRYTSDPYAAIEYVNKEAAVETVAQFFSIATLFYQGILLIGKLPSNENQIYGFVPESRDEPFYLADSIVDFFNQRITIIE